MVVVLVVVAAAGGGGGVVVEIVVIVVVVVVLAVVVGAVGHGREKPNVGFGCVLRHGEMKGLVCMPAEWHVACKSCTPQVYYATTLADFCSRFEDPLPIFRGHIALHHKSG